MNSYHAAILYTSIDGPPWVQRWVSEEDGYSHDNTTPILYWHGVYPPAVINEMPLAISYFSDYYYEDGAWQLAGAYPLDVCYWANDSAGDLYYCVRNVGSVSLYLVRDPRTASTVLAGTITVPNLDWNSRFGIYLDDQDRWHVAWTHGDGEDRVLQHLSTEDWGITSTITTLLGSGAHGDDSGNLNALSLVGREGHLFIATSVADRTPYQVWRGGMWATFYELQQGFVLLFSHDYGESWGQQLVHSMTSYTDPEYDGDQQWIFQADPGWEIPLCIGETGLLYYYVYSSVDNGEGARVLDGQEYVDYTTLEPGKPWGGMVWESKYNSGAVWFTQFSRQWVGGNGISAILWHKYNGTEYTSLMVADGTIGSTRLIDLTTDYEQAEIPYFVEWAKGGYSFWW